ncbi:unnamed protein product [Protopolystoma xenopodis]|uniref:Uncharacterized protein n=1 Tax=Protopolystoma xenopodis TaxID=117903 RepID=A0A3S5CPB6_9PLAT|nr:unnamed protein product [Protopolystoma xenopodis]
MVSCYKKSLFQPHRPHTWSVSLSAYVKEYAFTIAANSEVTSETYFGLPQHRSPDPRGQHSGRPACLAGEKVFWTSESVKPDTVIHRTQRYGELAECDFADELEPKDSLAGHHDPDCTSLGHRESRLSNAGQPHAANSESTASYGIKTDNACAG